MLYFVLVYVIKNYFISSVMSLRPQYFPFQDFCPYKRNRQGMNRCALLILVIYEYQHQIRFVFFGFVHKWKTTKVKTIKIFIFLIDAFIHNINIIALDTVNCLDKSHAVEGA